MANRTTIAVKEFDALRDRLMTVRNEHDQFVARKQASHGYVISVAAAIILPLGFLTYRFGVNIVGMSRLLSLWAFSTLCVVMSGITLGMIVLIKRLRWV